MAAGREHFGSRFAVIMAMAGSAIGLGNIWRFPYMVGENGGAAFILVYILSSFLLSLPIFFSEAVIGRSTHANTFGAMRQLAPGTPWRWLGLLTILSPVIILSYYSVVGGWSVEYLLKSLALQFRTEEAAAGFGLNNTERQQVICKALIGLCKGITGSSGGASLVGGGTANAQSAEDADGQRSHPILRVNADNRIHQHHAVKGLGHRHTCQDGQLERCGLALRIAALPASDGGCGGESAANDGTQGGEAKGGEGT